MSDIAVQCIKTGNNQSIFKVEIVEGETKTAHQVELNLDEYRKLTDGKISPEALIKSSFEFLLEREPKESILRSFNLSIISRYFPEYKSEIKNYF